jgi:hypothetical protein
VIDFRGCGSREASDVYQAFALLCARETVSSALLQTGDEDADLHFALRDVLATLALVAGIPLHLSLALVTGSPSIEQVCGTMQAELRSLGCDARVFRAEPQASEWLRAASCPTEAAAARPAGSRIPA